MFSTAPRAGENWSRVGVFCPRALGLEVFWGSLAPSVFFRPLPRGSELGHAASSLPKPPVPTPQVPTHPCTPVHRGPGLWLLPSPCHQSTSPGHVQGSGVVACPWRPPSGHPGAMGGSSRAPHPCTSWGPRQPVVNRDLSARTGRRRGARGRCEGCVGPGRGRGGPGGTCELGRGRRGGGEVPKAPPRELT